MKPRTKSQPAEVAGNSHVDLGEVQRLLDFMEQHGLEELDYESGSFRVHLKRPSARPTVSPVPRLEHPVHSSGSIGTVENSSTTEAPSGDAGVGTARGEELYVVKSPIVGTFYEASSPGASPLVNVGDHVEPGQVLCVIEAMKLMNEIESDVTGEVRKVFVENGHPVEYGEPLFGILPDRKK